MTTRYGERDHLWLERARSPQSETAFACNDGRSRRVWTRSSLSGTASRCVLITRRALDTCGLLDHEQAPHDRSDRLYCDVVRSYARLRIIYTPESKVYHFHQRSTADLRGRDAALFDAMKGQNEWEGILAARRERLAYPDAG